MPSLGSRIPQLNHAWRRLQAEHPKALERVLLGTTLVVTTVFVGFIWFIASLRSGLPSPDALGRIGEMDQATAVYDGSDQLAFTIFK